MYEYHGWATLQSSAGDIDSNRTENLLQSVNDVVTKLSDVNNVFDVSYHNGKCLLRIAGFSNHKQVLVEEVWRDVALLAPRSYGLLYIRDDEDPAFANRFLVLTLKRGVVKRENDPFLSPCVPVIEDP